MAVGAAAAALETAVETLATLAHPTDATGGDARHKGIVGNIASDYSTSSYKG